MDFIQADEYYSIVPEWVLDTPISAQAVRLYAVLNRYADKDNGTCFPAIKTLSKRMHTSVSTVKRALNELSDCGAVYIEPRYDKETNEQTSNLYTVMRKNPFIYEQPQSKDEPPASSPESYKLKPIKQRKNGALYVALETAMGYKPSTQVERGGWNKCVKELAEAGATPDDVEIRVKMYRENWKGITVTPYALIKHWSLLGDYIKEEPKVHDCNVSGHNMIDLEVIYKCQFCPLEQTKQNS